MQLVSLQVTLNEMLTTGRVGISLLGLTQEYLGPVGSKIVSATYLFIHYALLVAYIAQVSGLNQFLSCLTEP